MNTELTTVMKRGRGRPPISVDGAADSTIKVRTTSRRKAAYLRAANGQKLSVWLVAQLDRAAGYVEVENQ